MRKNEIKVGGHYIAKVSNKVVTVRIVATHPSGGWIAVNVDTGRSCRIRTAGRLRGEATLAKMYPHMAET